MSKKQPSPQTKQELMDYIDKIIEGPHDYDTSAEAMSQAAIAAFNFTAYTLGVTGFQAGWAEMRFIQEMRDLELPFMILDSSRLLYPQYNLHNQAEEFIQESQEAVAIEAKRLLEINEGASKQVRERWEDLADWYDNVFLKKEEEQ